jgi:hypothetical protein
MKYLSKRAAQSEKLGWISYGYGTRFPRLP